MTELTRSAQVATPACAGVAGTRAGGFLACMRRAAADESGRQARSGSQHVACREICHMPVRIGP